MPTFPAIKNQNAILSRIKQNIESRTGISDWNRDSAIRALVDSMIDELIEEREERNSAFRANHIDTASGRQLDNIAPIDRRRPTYANVQPNEQNLMLYVESGTFGDINNGADIFVPANQMTISSTVSNNEFGQIVNYRNTQSVVLPAAGSSVYISAQAEAIGSSSNVGRYVLSTHDFIGYSDHANSSLKVINTFPILNGRDRESDEQFRYRINNLYSAMQQSNDSRIQLNLLQVPGVVDFRVIPGYFGIGTVGVILLGPENISTPALVNSAQQQLNEISAPGLEVRATSAVEVKFDLDLKVTLTEKLTALSKRSVRTEIVRVVSSYFSSLGLGQTVSFQDLAGLIKQRVPNIRTLSSRQDLPFERILIRKSLSSLDNPNNEELITPNYMLESDEYGTLGVLNISFED